MAWLSDWAHRVKLTIDQGDINAALSNFPIMVALGTSVGRNSDDVSFIFDELESDANRHKIAVTTADGVTQCYVEVEWWNDAGEVAWLWVKVPSIASDADTDLYLYFDKSKPNNNTYVGGIASTPGKAVWSNNYVAVFHQRDKTSTTIDDSGPYGNHGTKAGVNRPMQAAFGRIAVAQDYESANTEHVDHGYHPSMDVSNITLEGWVSRDAADHRDPVLDRRWAGSGYQVYSFEVLASDRIQWWFKDDADNQYGPWQSDSPVGTGWHHVVVTYDGVNVRFYLDGDPDGVDPETGALGTASGKLLRTGVSWTVYADAIIDEIRMHSDAKPPAWIKAEFESERDDLVDFGSEQTLIADGTAAGSGIGLAEATAYLIISGLASGEGIGLAAAAGYLKVLAQASGEGIGLAEATGEVVVEGVGAGSGIGLGRLDGLGLVLAQAAGSGVGTLVADASIIPYLYWQLILEVPILRARIEELELALVPKAHYRL